MKRLVTAAAALALAASAAAPLSAQGRPGSIYDPDHGPFGAIADKTARRPGDLLTVVIAEDLDLKNEETSTLQRATGLEYEVSAFDLAPSLADLPFRVAASSDDDFTGVANYEKKGEFNARVTAIVDDVLPNGNMVIVGRREIRIDQETKLIEIRGVVRRYDVRPDNTILSSQVAEAHVAYVGSGPLTNATNRRGLGGWLHSLFSWAWPF